MSDNKHTQSMPSGSISLEALYNVLMEQIDPDLTTYNIKTLDEIYAGETKRQRKARAERYAKSFEVCYRVFEHLGRKLKLDLQAARSHFFKGMEEQALPEDEATMQDIEDSFSAA